MSAATALVDKLADVIAALREAGCSPKQREGVFSADCPVCRTSKAIEARPAPVIGTNIACSKGCAGPDLAAHLGLEPVKKRPGASLVRTGSRTTSNPGSRTTSNHPPEPGSSLLKERTGSRTSSSDQQKPATARTTAPNHPLAFEALGDFMARTAILPEPSWLIAELVPESGRVTFVAAPSAGKTFLELVAAKAAAAAGRPVYLVLEEGSAKGTHNRFKALQFPAGASIQVLHQRGVKLAEHAEALADLLRRHLDGPAPVMALDPFAAVFSGNENDTQEMAAAVELMNGLMRANPRTLLMVPHHTSKAGELSEGAGMYSSRGGSGLPAWADVQLNLKHVPTPKGAGLVSFDATMAKNRDGERDYGIRVTISLGDGSVEMAPLEEVKREAKVSNLRERLIAFIAQGSGPLSKNKIDEGVRGTKTEKLRLIDELTREGVLANDGAGWTVAPDRGQGERVTPNNPDPKSAP